MKKKNVSLALISLDWRIRLLELESVRSNWHQSSYWPACTTSPFFMLYPDSFFFDVPLISFSALLLAFNPAVKFIPLSLSHSQSHSLSLLIECLEEKRLLPASNTLMAVTNMM